MQGEGGEGSRGPVRRPRAAMGSRDFQVTGGLTKLFATNPAKMFERVS